MHWHRIQMGENASSLNFILLPSPEIDNWVSGLHLLHCSSLENAAYDVWIYWNVLWIAKSLNISTFPCYGTLCFKHVSTRFCLSTVTLPMPLIFGSMSQISGGASYILEHPLIVSRMVGLSFHYFHLLAFRSWVQQQSSYSIILALHDNSRLCCMYFSYHWCKIGNVSHPLTQITKRQCDRCAYIKK